MGNAVRVNTEISEDLNASLQRLADQQGESKDALIEHALRLFVESEERFAAAVQESLTAWESGDVVDHADVEAAFVQRYGRPA